MNSFVSKNNTFDFFRKLLNPGFKSVSWQIIYKTEIMGIGMALVYLCNDFFFYQGPKNTMVGIFVIPFYILLLILTIKKPDNKIILNIVVINFFISMIISFSFLAGRFYVSTPTVIDFSLSFLIVTIVYRNYERIIWILLHIIVLSVFIYLSVINNPGYAPGALLAPYSTEVIFPYVEIFSRLIFIFILGITFVSDYDYQRQLVLNKNEEVIHLNKNLEKLVQMRTEKLNDLYQRLRNYSYANSHKVRAPLATMMGILNLINQEKNNIKNENVEKYIFLLEKSAGELDQIIQEMNDYLSEQDE